MQNQTYTPGDSKKRPVKQTQRLQRGYSQRAGSGTGQKDWKQTKIGGALCFPGHGVHQHELRTVLHSQTEQQDTTSVFTVFRLGNLIEHLDLELETQWLVKRKCSLYEKRHKDHTSIRLSDSQIRIQGSGCHTSIRSRMQKSPRSTAPGLGWQQWLHSPLCGGLPPRCRTQSSYERTQSAPPRQMPCNAMHMARV